MPPTTTTIPGNLPPNCSHTAASPAALWPPNHQFVDVSVVGVTDADGDPVAVTITDITQDEPLDGAEDGTCPDATGVGTATASLRAERAGGGDGRVYHIGFTADDGRGGRCTGTVTVCVPHDQGKGRVCGDQGPLVDSTGPCVGTTTTTSSPPTTLPIVGHMEAGGTSLVGTDSKYDIKLGCDPTVHSQHFETTFMYQETKVKFTADQFLDALCEDVPGVTPEKVDADFNTISGTAVGHLDKFPGSYTAVYSFQDDGKSPTGTNAGYYRIEIRGTGQVIFATSPTVMLLPVDKGNNEASPGAE